LGDFAAELLCALVVPADDAELCPVERLDAARLVLHHRGQSDRLVHALAGVAERPAQRVVRPDDHLVWGVAAVASVTASAATTIAAVAAITAVAAVAAVTATASQGTGDAGRTPVFDKRPSTDTIRGISSHTRFVCDGCTYSLLRKLVIAVTDRGRPSRLTGKRIETGGQDGRSRRAGKTGGRDERARRAVETSDRDGR